MKLFKYKINSQMKEKTERGKFNFERFLFISFVFSFSLLILVQALLATPLTNSIITQENVIDGTPLEDEEVLYKEGEVVLQQSGSQPNGQLKVLINGDEAVAFVSETVKLNVKEGDIIEIDASEIDQETEVDVISKSDNISSECLSKIYLVKPGVQELTKIKINEN